MRRAYISHPIKGLEIDVARRNSERAGHAISKDWGLAYVLPMDIDPHHEGDCSPGGESGQSEHTHTCYMRADLRAQMRCSDIVLCLGWQNSQGCRAELAAALAAGQTVWVETKDHTVMPLPVLP